MRHFVRLLFVGLACSLLSWQVQGQVSTGPNPPNSTASLWETAFTNPSDPDFVVPDYPIIFVSAPVIEEPWLEPDEELCPDDCEDYDSSCTSAPVRSVRGRYHIGFDVLSASDPDPGNKLWIYLPANGRVVKLFPRASHAGLILDSPSVGSVVEPNISEDGTVVYFSYFHNADDPQIRSGADIFRMDISLLLSNPNANIGNLPVHRMTDRNWTPGNPQVDRHEHAMNPTLSVATEASKFGTVYMHPIEMRTKDGLKLVYVSDEKRLRNSNKEQGGINHNFNLFIADIDSTDNYLLKNRKQFQYYTTTSALSPAPLRDGLAFSYQSTTENARNWHIQGMDSEGKWYPIIGYGSTPNLYHLGSFCVDDSGPTPKDYFVAVQYYNGNNEGYGALFKQDLSTLAANIEELDPPYRMTRQFGQTKITPQSAEGDQMSEHLNGVYYGKYAAPRCGRPNELFFTYTPTSANGKSSERDLQCSANIYHGYIGFRDSLEDYDPLITPHKIVVRAKDDLFNAAWATPVLPWSERTGDTTQQYSDSSIEPSLAAIPGDPFAQVGTSALYNTDRKPFDCYVNIPSAVVRPYNPQGVHGKNNDDDHVIHAQDGWTHVYDQNDLCHENLSASEAYRKSRVLGIAVNLTSNKTNWSGNFGYDTDGKNRSIEASKLLGIYDVRGQTNSQGELDQSFKALIPANVPFDFHLLDKLTGMKLTDVRSWHSLKPFESRTDCGGCHQHEGAAVPFAGTYAETSAPLDMVRATQVLSYSPGCTPQLTTTTSALPTVQALEWKADIWNGMVTNCASCHTSNAQAKMALDLSDEATAYQQINDRQYADSNRGAIGSQLWWAARGDRMDGRDNNHPDLQADYSNDDWGFFYSDVHDAVAGGRTDCADHDPAYADWVLKLGQWIDNHMPRDTDDAYPYKSDWFHPTMSSAISAAGCAPTELRVGWWDDSDQIRKILVETVDPSTVVYSNIATSAPWIANGSATFANSFTSPTQVLKFTAIDRFGNRQIYEKSVAELETECAEY